MNKYGQLGKLVEVDLSPVEQITLMFHCSDMDIFPREIKVKPSMTVLQLKTQVSEIIGGSATIIMCSFLLASGPVQCGTNRGGGWCHPFHRSRSHLEEADDARTRPTVTEVRFKRMTLVLRYVCLTHLATAAWNVLWSLNCFR